MTFKCFSLGVVMRKPSRFQKLGIMIRSRRGLLPSPLSISEKFKKEKQEIRWEKPLRNSNNKANDTSRTM